MLCIFKEFFDGVSWNVHFFRAPSRELTRFVDAGRERNGRCAATSRIKFVRDEMTSCMLEVSAVYRVDAWIGKSGVCQRKRFCCHVGQGWWYM